MKDKYAMKSVYQGARVVVDWVHQPPVLCFESYIMKSVQVYQAAELWLTRNIYIVFFFFIKTFVGSSLFYH